MLLFACCPLIHLNNAKKMSLNMNLREVEEVKISDVDTKDTKDTKTI